MNRANLDKSVVLHKPMACYRPVKSLVLVSLLASWLATPRRPAWAAKTENRELIVVINPRSGRFVKHPEEIEQIKRLAGAHGKVYVPPTAEAFRQAAKEIAHLPNPGKKVLVPIGGDGLIQHLLNDIARENPSQLPSLRILPLQGGSNNTIVKNLKGLSGNPVDVLSDYIATVQANAPHPDGVSEERGEPRFDVHENRVPFLEVNDQGDVQRGLFFVTGVPGELLAGTDGKIHVGKAFFSVLKQMMTGSKRLHRVPAKLSLNGIHDEKDRKLLYAVVSGLTKTHPLLRILKKPNPGELSVKASSMSIPETILKGADLVTGLSLTRNPNKEVSASTKELQIEFNEPGIHYSIDGELYKSNSKTLKVTRQGDLNLLSLEKRGGGGRGLWGLWGRKLKETGARVVRPPKARPR